MKTNHTQENLKKYFYTSIGHLAHTGDIFQKSAQELSKRGNVTEADGREIIQKAMLEIERKYNEAVHKFISITGAETAKIEERLAKLEKRLLLKTKNTDKRVKPVVKTTRKSPRRSSRKVTHAAM